MEKREFGSTGESLTLLGLGGFHLLEISDGDSDVLINTYLDRGGNYIETAAQYGEGESERKIGRIMKDRRDECFLTTKCHVRDWAGAAQTIDESLARLQTDHADLLLFHHVQSMEEYETIFSPGGAAEAFCKAQEDGKTRYNPPAGIPELRAAIAEQAGRQRGLAFQSDQVAVGPGAKPILFLPTLALVEPGDEVIYPDPGFPTYKAMIEVAAGGCLPLRQEDVRIEGHAIECRIIAEDPTRNFAPSPGTIRGLRPPNGPGIRYDDGTYPGYTVPMFYDPLVAKLIAWGRDRREAIRRMARALEELRIDGLMTSVSFHRKVMEHEAFLRGDLHTGFLDEHPELVTPKDDPLLSEIAVVAAAVAHFRRAEARSAQGPGGCEGRARSNWKWHGRGGGWRS